MKLTATEAYVLIQVVQGQTVHEAPVSNNVRALMAAISGAATYPGAISSETRTLVRAFLGELTVNPASENGRAIVAALNGKDSRNWPISTNVRQLCIAIFNQEDGDGDPAPPVMTNVQKLALPSNTAVGTIVYVSDWEDAGLSGPIQTLAAPSSAQGGVAVIGGMQDGVYSLTAIENRAIFNLLGHSGESNYRILWDENGNFGDPFRWILFNDVGDPLYYSLSDVATPDLASNWKKASDDSAAGITVTSVSLGEIYAGLAITHDGAVNGSSYVSAPFHGRQYYMGLNGGGSNNMHWDTDFNVWTDDVGAWTSNNVVFPWQGTGNGGGHTGATFARNDVANERNWVNS